MESWIDCLGERTRPGHALVGLLPGEGVGAELVGGAVSVLEAVAGAARWPVELVTGGAIGRAAERESGQPLTDDVVEFCERVLARGGAILNGPGGGRYVYDLRRRLDLFFKISPLRSADGVPGASPFAAGGVDVLITREGTAGIYQGRWDEGVDAAGARYATLSATYTEPQVTRFLEASARLARMRRGRLAVVWKEAGLPGFSTLWGDVAATAARRHGVELALVDVDLMGYRLVAEPLAFDVVATPNLFGDVLADLGAVLVGSRGVSYSGNFDGRGRAVYQTNHGAAYDLAGTDRANPGGQLLSLAMMLRESFDRPDLADAIRRGLAETWADGLRTADVAHPGARAVGTAELCARVAERAARLVGRT